MLFYNLDFFVFECSGTTAYFAHRYCNLILHFISLCGPFNPKNLQIINQHIGYKTLTRGLKKNIPTWDGKIKEAANTHGLSFMIKNGIGRKPQLQKSHIDMLIDEVGVHYPDFKNKPKVAILLRGKGALKPMFNERYHNGTRYLTLGDGIRQPGEQSNYIEAVEYLVSKGFFVCGTGETDHEIFNHIPGYIDLAQYVAPKLANAFLLTEAKMLIGQHSGPQKLTFSSGCMNVLCDVGTYHIGTLGGKDLLLHKPFLVGTEKKEFNIVEITQSYPQLLFGNALIGEEVTVRSNTSKEILQTVVEAVEVYNGTYMNEAARLADLWRALIPDELRIKTDPSRPPLFILDSINEKVEP